MLGDLFPAVEELKPTTELKADWFAEGYEQGRDEARIRSVREQIFNLMTRLKLYDTMLQSNQLNETGHRKLKQLAEEELKKHQDSLKQLETKRLQHHERTPTQ